MQYIEHAITKNKIGIMGLKALIIILDIIKDVPKDESDTVTIRKNGVELDLFISGKDHYYSFCNDSKITIYSRIGKILNRRIFDIILDEEISKLFLSYIK